MQAVDTASEDTDENLPLVGRGPAGRKAVDTVWALWAKGAAVCRSEGRLELQDGGGGKGPLEIV